MPYGMKRENSTRPEGEIYNSGKVKMQQNGSKLNITISEKIKREIEGRIIKNDLPIFCNILILEPLLETICMPNIFCPIVDDHFVDKHIILYIVEIKNIETI